MVTLKHNNGPHKGSHSENDVVTIHLYALLYSWNSLLVENKHPLSYLSGELHGGCIPFVIYQSSDMEGAATSSGFLCDLGYKIRNFLGTLAPYVKKKKNFS